MPQNTESMAHLRGPHTPNAYFREDRTLPISEAPSIRCGDFRTGDHVEKAELPWQHGNSLIRFQRTPEGYFFTPVIERQLISLAGHIGLVTTE